MNQPINYRQVLSGVEEEIKMLSLEKSEIEANLGKMQNRLTEIQTRAEKLELLFQSLTNFLETTGVTDNGQDASDLFESSRNMETTKTDSVQLEKNESSNNQKSAAPSKKRTDGGESLFDELFGVLPSETSKPENGIAESSNDSQLAEQFSDSENNVIKSVDNLGEESTDAGDKAESNNDNQITADDLATVQKKSPQEFDRADFYSHYPHLKGVQQTVPILARTLLEYFSFGLKLGEITKLIVTLGHRHSAKNFTDTVHSALKHKRATTGEFVFNPIDRVWELAHWSKDKEPQNDPQTTDAAKPSEPDKPASKSEAAQNRGMARKLTAEFSQTLAAKNKQ